MKQLKTTAFFFSLLVLTGCGEPTLEDRLVGAWYGEGPDEDQCFIFCGDGRLFTGDSPCDQGNRGDFARSLPVSFGEDSFTVNFSGEYETFAVSFSGDNDSTMTYMLDGMSYSTSRVAVPDYCSTRP